jgi:hypothetical protein
LGFTGAPLAPHTKEEDRKTREDGDANSQNIRDLTPEGRGRRRFTTDGHG